MLNKLNQKHNNRQINSFKMKSQIKLSKKIEYNRMTKELFRSLVAIGKLVEQVMIRFNKCLNPNNKEDSWRESKILKNK